MDIGRIQEERRISEKLAKYKHLITVPNTEKHTTPSRLTCPTRPTIDGAARTPTRLTSLTRPTRPTIASAARTLTRPTIASAARTLTRPTIAGAARTPTRLTRPPPFPILSALPAIPAFNLEPI